jgi:hypothetical protein
LFVDDTNNSDNTGAYTVTLDYIPEPLSLSLFGVGLAGMTIIRRRRAG